MSEQERKVTTSKCDTIIAFKSSIQWLHNSFTSGNRESGKVNDTHCIFSWVLRCMQHLNKTLGEERWSKMKSNEGIQLRKYNLEIL